MYFNWSIHFLLSSLARSLATLLAFHLILIINFCFLSQMRIDTLHLNAPDSVNRKWK